ncbi:MAG: UPF0182 family protein [Armatimonadota bacterium]
MTNAQRKLMWFIGVFVALILLQKVFIFYTDYLWFDAMALSSVFLTILKSRIFLFFVFGGIFFIWLYGNALYARRPLPDDVTLIGKRLLPDEEREQIEEYADQAILIFCVVGALMVGFVAAGHWREYLQFFNAVNFGPESADPLFGRDAGFYVFKFSFIQYAWRSLFYAIVIALVVSIPIHLYQESIRIVGNTVQAIQRARCHILGLLGLALFTKIYSYQLMKYGLLFSQRGQDFFGATYADVHARLPVLTILMALCAIAGVIALISIKTQSINVPLGAVAAVIVVSLVGGWLYPAAIQKLVVAPNELEKETPFIEYNIKGTNMAYGTHRVKEKRHPVQPKLTWDSINENVETVANIRLWDHRPLETSYNQLQALRKYYKFSDVDVDRYQLEGRVRQVMLATRQIDWPKISQSWVNQHLLYTHGYGVAMSPVSEITESDLPVFWIKDLPPVSDVGLELTRPAVYYGASRHPRLIERIAPPEFERDGSMTPQPPHQPGDSGDSSAGPPGPLGGGGQQQPGPSPAAQRTAQERQTVPQYHLVNTKAKELDYPRAGSEENGGTAENVYTHYEGTGGVKLDSLWKKIAFTIRFRDIQLLLTEYLTPESRLQMYRELPERLAVIAPFLGYDPDPYVVVNEAGQLKWICDAYTLSNDYPYSVRTTWFGNYVRNAVKVVVDAYEGQPEFYVVEPDDPVVQCYRKIFPKLFTDFAQMPEDMKAHLRYPQLQFRIQAGIWAKYHQKEPQTFYQAEDEWAIPPEIYSQGYREVEAYYQVVELPHEDKAEFVLMLPYVLAQFERKNMVAWLGGRCDPDNYGELICYSFPKDSLVYGPMQFEAQIDQDSRISELITLWSQAGSRVIRGNALAIPVADSILYVEPIYLESEDSAIPELRLVVLMHQDQLVHAPTLDEALVKLLGPGVFAGPKMGEDADVDAAAKEVIEEIAEVEEKPAAAEAEVTTAVGMEMSDAQLKQLRETLSEALKLDREAETYLKEGDLGKYRATQQEQAEMLSEVLEELQ